MTRFASYELTRRVCERQELLVQKKSHLTEMT